MLGMESDEQRRRVESLLRGKIAEARKHTPRRIEITVWTPELEQASGLTGRDAVEFAEEVLDIIPGLYYLGPSQGTDRLGVGRILFTDDSGLQWLNEDPD